LEQLESFLEIILSHVASSLNVKGVGLTRFYLLNLSAVVKSPFDVTFLEAAPSQVLVDLEVVFIANDSSFVLVHSLVVVLHFLVQQTNLDQSVSLPLQRESVGQNGVLEVANSLLDLVGFRKDHAKFVEDLALLVEVGRHL
jgi:hypothetical protein